MTGRNLLTYSNTRMTGRQTPTYLLTQTQERSRATERQEAEDHSQTGLSFVDAPFRFRSAFTRRLP